MQGRVESCVTQSISLVFKYPKTKTNSTRSTVADSHTVDAIIDIDPRVVLFESNPPVTLHSGTQLSELLPDVFVVFDPVLVHRKFVMMS